MFEKSFYLVRTNPALTTNVKLVVSNDQKLFLESYAATKSLGAERFQHFAIDKESYLFEEIPNFFAKISAETAFQPRTANDDSVMYDDFVNQFDDIYLSGATWAQDTFYEEEFEYTAPLWIKKDALPKSFIIMRVDGPGLDDGNSPVNFRSEILSSWKIVDYFDLTEKSELGIFLRRQIDHKLFPDTALNVNFENLRMSTFNGIDYNRMGYISKFVNLENNYQKNTPIFRSEEYFTNQWRDLGVIFPFILNLKYLYDDTPATPTILRRWSLNRYLGFYLDDLEENQEISPYEPFALNKVPNEVIQQLTAEEVSEISYLLDNAFVQDLNSRRYSFDPILGGWLDGKTYYVEWEGQFFRLDKTENDTDVIIGDYLYKVNSTVNIEYDVPEEIIDPDLQAQYRKVLINEISTLKNQIVIVDRLVFENTIGNNVIQHTNTTYTTLDRNYALYLDKGRLKWGFTITLDAELNNNVFSISNYEEADLYWIQMNDRKFAIKQYPLNIPNIGGLYYIHADDAIRVNNISEEIWINNGINTKDENYYNYNDVQNVPDDKYPLFYKIFRASFSDIKDFDFDRVETQYSDYEYRLESSIVETSEPKLYARDRRNIHIAIQKPVELTDSNFTNEQLREYLFSEPVTYTEWLQQYENTISKNGDEQFFERYEFYVDFKWNNIVNEEAFSIGNQSYNDASDSNSVSLTVGTYQALLPLYVNPTRIPILDSNGEQFLDPLTNEPLWQRDWVGDYVFTTNSAPTTELIDLDREWYREEGYILLQQDEPNEETISLDFKSTSEPLAIKIKYPWDDPANNDPRTTLYPMAYEFKWSPFSKSSKDPNEVIDTNYVPVSSEYITSEELWETRNNNLSPIWFKNQHICKWGYLNSVGHADYPYRLNYDLEVGGVYNQSPNPFSTIPYAVRQFRDLDYFYRFGITDLPTKYAFYSLHLKEQYFDIDKYLTADYDYFDWIFRSDILNTAGLFLTKKYSIFNLGDDTLGSTTVFKGIKYALFDVTDIEFNEEYLQENIQVVEDYVRTSNSKYNDYKFSIVLGRKLSTFQFNSGDNDGDFGIDVYLNDKWKNCLIHLYFESDQIITVTTEDEDGNTIVHNLETTEIDNLYDSDTIINQETNEDYWEFGKIRINGNQQIGDLRVRDIRLYSFLAIINEPNYDPVNGEGRRSVRYIHVYEDETFKIFDSTDTDFTLEFTLPEQFLIKEKTFTTEMRHQTALEVNNTIRNRIIQDDDPNNPLGNPDYTSKGALVDSITDFNAWDGYPFARVINDGNANDRRELYDLDQRRDPEIYRHNGPYVPIMKTLSLFRPTSYWTLTESSEEAEIVLNSNNWKFYDDYSDGEQSGLILREFGYIDEFIFSKVNLGGNILKLARLSRGDANRTDLRSIYPIVDEYGYDFTERYIFQSTWDRFFYIESRKMQLPINEYPGKSGYAVYFNGSDAKLMVDDTEKFNVVADDYEFQYSNPPSIDVDFTALDIMNLIDEASVEPINWTLGRSGVGELEFDSALKFTNSGEAYWEYNTNIRVFEGQEINMTVTAKSNEGDNRMKFYCGIRQYNNNYNGKTQGGSSVTESVGTNDGHIYFVASAEVLTTAYTTYSGTYTVASGVSYVRPLILFNHLFSSQLPSTGVNTMWAKDFNFQFENTELKTQIQILDLDESKTTKFIFINKNTGQRHLITLPEINDSIVYNYIFSDTNGFVDAFNILNDKIVLVSSSIIQYKIVFDDDEIGKNGHKYISQSSEGTQSSILASAHINSDISDGDIQFIIRTNTRGNIQFTALIEGADAFNLDDFVTAANRFLMPDYQLNANLKNLNLAYTIEATADGPQYNFTIESIRNAVEDKSQHVNSPQETKITQYSNVGQLTYVGENGDTYDNKAITSMTVEFWINIDGFTKQNETILYKGNFIVDEEVELDENGEPILDSDGFPVVVEKEKQVFSWLVRRYENSTQIEFATRSYTIDENLDFVNINVEETGVHEDRLVTNKSIEDQLWHHVGCVFDTEKRQKRIYIDGVINTIVSHVNFTNIIIDPNSDVDAKDWPLYIASDYRNGIINFTGSVDELRIWNHARTEQEILKSYNLRVTPSAYLDPFKSLIGNWVFDEQLGTPIVDNSIVVNDVERIEIIRTIETNTGNQLVSDTITNYVQNEQSLFEPVNINQDDTGIEWIVSGAEILGGKDERYESQLPPRTTNRKAKDLPVEIVPRSKYVIEFELPAPPPPQTPRAMSTIPAPPPVKVVEVPRKSKRKAISKKPLRIKRKFALRPIPSLSASFTLNKIDLFSKKRKRLQRFLNANEKFELEERIINIRQNPYRILNKRTRILRKPQTVSVNIGKNRRGLVSSIKRFYYRPKIDTFRRNR